jgi:hypothetical protein
MWVLQGAGRSYVGGWGVPHLLPFSWHCLAAGALHAKPCTPARQREGRHHRDLEALLWPTPNLALEGGGVLCCDGAGGCWLDRMKSYDRPAHVALATPTALLQSHHQPAPAPHPPAP